MMMIAVIDSSVTGLYIMYFLSMYVYFRQAEIPFLIII